MTGRLVASALVALALGGGCASHAGLRCAPGEDAAIDDVLYFGLSRPADRVDDAEWATFLREVVTPRFPAGFSAWPVAGQWRTAEGTIVREDSVAVAVVHADDAASEASIRRIADEYKRRFAQEAVLRVKRSACTSF